MNIDRDSARNVIIVIVILLIIVFGYSWAERYDENKRKHEETTIIIIINNANSGLIEHILNPSMGTAANVYIYYSEEAQDSIDKKCYYLEETIVYVMGENYLKQQRARQQKIALNFESDVQITGQTIVYKWFRPIGATVWTTENWKGDSTFHKYSLGFNKKDGWKIINDEWQKTPFADRQPEAKGYMLR